MSDEAIAIVLWCVTALLLGWTWFPALFATLGGTRFSAGGSDDPTSFGSESSEAGYAAIHEQLSRLGYEPLGTAWMRITFHGQLWRYEIQIRVLYSRTKKVYVLVQKQPKPMDVWWLTMFATCWNDGGLLLTSNVLTEAPDDGDYIVQGMETHDFAAVEQLHFSKRDQMQAAGKRPDSDASLETLLTAIRKHTSEAARYVAMKLGQTYITTHALIHVFLSVPIVFISGFAHWSVPFTNLILGGLLAGGEYVARQRAGRSLRAQAHGLAERA